MVRNDRYKRKFRVPGNTPNSNICDDCYASHNSGYPCSSQYQNRYVYNYIPEPQNCIIPDKAFKKYLVSETLDGHWVCSCPRGKFHRVNGNSTCKHVTKAKLHPRKYKIPINVTVSKIEVAESL